MNALIVTENRFLSKLISALLHREGFNASIATSLNGAEKYFGAGIQPKFLFVDICGDGKQELQWIETILKQANNTWVPILAMLDDKDEGLLQKAYDAGISDYVSKHEKKFIIQSKIATFKNMLAKIELLEASNQKLSRLTTVDPITLLPNKAGFYSLSNKAVKYCCRQNQPLAILKIEIKNFERYKEDRYYESGLECIGLIATAIDNAVSRPMDIVGRLGDKAFAVVLPDTNLIGAEAVSDNIKNAIKLLSLAVPQSTRNKILTVDIDTVHVNWDDDVDIETILMDTNQNHEYSDIDVITQSNNVSLLHSQEKHSLIPTLALVAN